MRKRSMMTSMVIFLLIGGVLFILKQWEAGIISVSFSVVTGLGVLVIIFMEKLENKKLDEKHFVRRKEFLLRDYAKLTNDYNKNKLKSLNIVVLKLTKEHDEKILKDFGRWLKEAFPADPKGYDDGIVILFANIHESLIEELIKQMRKRLKEVRVGVSFKAGYAYYSGNEEYENLRALAEESIK